jgi:DNA-binding transcriptional LysR family regulator
MVSLARTGYGIATLPCAAIASDLETGDLVALEGAPELSPLPVIASRRRQSESPLIGVVVQLAVDAARTFSNAVRPGLVEVDAKTP